MEIFFIILLGIALLTLQFFLTRIKTPKSRYVKIISAIALLILVWIGGTDASFGPKLILSTIAFTRLWKEYLSYKKNKQVSL